MFLADPNLQNKSSTKGTNNFCSNIVILPIFIIIFVKLNFNFTKKKIFFHEITKKQFIISFQSTESISIELLRFLRRLFRSLLCPESVEESDESDVEFDRFRARPWRCWISKNCFNFSFVRWFSSSSESFEELLEDELEEELDEPPPLLGSTLTTWDLILGFVSMMEKKG